MKHLIALSLFIFSLYAGSAIAAQTIIVGVNGMVCAFCAQGIEKKMRALPQTQDVYVNLKQKIVAVEIKEGGNLSYDTVKELIKDAGYDITKIETVEESTTQIKTRLEKEKTK